MVIYEMVEKVLRMLSYMESSLGLVNKVVFKVISFPMKPYDPWYIIMLFTQIDWHTTISF
jgi:hypothetical protein